MSNDNNGCGQECLECFGLAKHQNVIGDNPLAKVEKYNLILECQEPSNTAEFENALQEYAQTTINRADFGEQEIAVFYKAHVYKRMTEDGLNHRYTIQFFLYSGTYWNESIHRETESSLKQSLAKFDIANIKVSYVINELIHDIKRQPFSDEEAQDQGWGEIPGNCCEKFVNWWLIVPSVQWRFFGLLYQMYTFDIFHQGFIAKFVHFITIPTNVTLTMCFLAQFSFFGVSSGSGAFTVNGGLALMIILVVLYLIMGINARSIPWGFATSIVIFVCWLSGNLWYAGHKTTTNPWYNPTTWPTNPIIWSYVMSFIQALSHTATGSIPPYISGYQHWESLHVFFCKRYDDPKKRCTSICFIVMSLIAFPIFSVSVAWFSWPHLIGTEIIYIMAGIGYQPGFFKKYQIIIEKAESTGDPGIADFPSHPRELTNAKYKPFVDNLVALHLLHENPTPKEIMECASTCNMLANYKYFKHGNQHINKDCVNHYNLISKGMQKMPKKNFSPV